MPQETPTSVSLLENTMKTNLNDVLYFLDDRTSFIFPLYLGVYIFHDKVKIDGRINSSIWLTKKSI